LATAHRARARIDGHLIRGGVWQRLARIRGEYQDRRTRPAEGSADGRLDSDERRLHLRWNPAQRHHRLRKDDADLVCLIEFREFAGRSGALNDQRGWGLGVGGENAGNKNHRQSSGATKHLLHLSM